jgi:hypothetical protein
MGFAFFSVFNSSYVNLDNPNPTTNVDATYSGGTSAQIQAVVMAP